MNIVEQLRKAEERATALNSDLSAALASIATLTTDRTGLTGKVAELVTALEASKADVSARDAKVAEDAATIDARDKEIADAKDSVARLEKALADPAYRDAKAPGGAPVESFGEAGDTKTKAQLESEYAKIDDPKQRAAFRDAHRAELGLPPKR